MPNDGPRLLAGFRKLDAAMARAGRHPTAAPWLSTLERFWLSGKRRLVVRKGRQGGGSTTLARVAVATAKFGEHHATRGTHLVFPFVSVSMREARERLFNIEDVLTVIGERFTRRDDTIELADGCVFAVYACSARFSVGMTSGSLFEDEVSRWWSDDANANPAIEVDGAIVPSLITQPNGRIYTISSPMGTDDFHATLMARGESEAQCIASGPSWYWNPSITEEATHDVQPDEIRWRREFAAIPSVGAYGAFDAAVVGAMVRDLHPGAEGISAGALVIDSSSGRGDGWSFGIAQYALEPCDEPIYQERAVYNDKGERTMNVIVYDENGRPVANPKHAEPKRVLWLSALGCFEGAFASTVSFAEVVAEIARLGRRYGVTKCFGDQHLAFSLESEFAKHGLRFVERAWSAPTKIEAASTLRRLLRERTIVAEPGPEADALKRELLSVEERLLPSGALTVQARRSGTGHADRASLALLIARCESEGDIAGSPIARGGGMRVYDRYTNTEDKY